MRCIALLALLFSESECAHDDDFFFDTLLTAVDTVDLVLNPWGRIKGMENNAQGIFASSDLNKDGVLDLAEIQAGCWDFDKFVNGQLNGNKPSIEEICASGGPINVGKFTEFAVRTMYVPKYGALPDDWPKEPVACPKEGQGTDPDVNDEPKASSPVINEVIEASGPVTEKIIEESSPVTEGASSPVIVQAKVPDMDKLVVDFKKGQIVQFTDKKSGVLKSGVLDEFEEDMGWLVDLLDENGDKIKDKAAYVLPAEMTLVDSTAKVVGVNCKGVKWLSTMTLDQKKEECTGQCKYFDPAATEFASMSGLCCPGGDDFEKDVSADKWKTFCAGMN